MRVLQHNSRTCRAPHRRVGWMMSRCTYLLPKFYMVTSAVFIECFAKIKSPKPGAKRSTCFSMALVISTVDPPGTWQYAQPVCFPLGALDESNRLCCASKTKGFSGYTPSQHCCSEAAISDSVLPIWTVPARRHSLAENGIGPSNAQSTLKTPIP